MHEPTLNWTVCLQKYINSLLCWLLLNVAYIHIFFKYKSIVVFSFSTNAASFCKRDAFKNACLLLLHLARPRCGWSLVRANVSHLLSQPDAAQVTLVSPVKAHRVCGKVRHKVFLYPAMQRQIKLLIVIIQRYEAQQSHSLSVFCVLIASSRLNPKHSHPPGNKMHKTRSRIITL